MKSLYHNFIGIDISKNECVVGFVDKKQTKTYANTTEGWESLYKDLKDLLENAFVVLEVTGGYEKGLLMYLVEREIATHRADTRKVKHFIRSLGVQAKTDHIDARALATYAQQRHAQLMPYAAPSALQDHLRLLIERRMDLVKMLVAEKNRAKAPESLCLLEGIQAVIACLGQQIDGIDSQMKEIFAKHQTYAHIKKILMSVPGIGEKTAHTLIALLPELGHLDRKKIASLCGVAPHLQQSGSKTWRAKTSGGRRELRPVLFLAAMAARRSKTHLGSFYHSLIQKGKKPLVALGALMRKIVVIANAKVRDFLALQTQIA